MNCQVCGHSSGKYPLCKACNAKKEQGLIIKCSTCGQWHYKSAECSQKREPSAEAFLYEPKKSLISKSEQGYFAALKEALPEGYFVFPQVNLAAFVSKTDNSRYQNELFRNVDFLITDSDYVPKIAVEINDQSHLYNDRRSRDEKVKQILEEAGIPLLKLWTSYGVRPDYISGRVTELLNTPFDRQHHFEPRTAQHADVDEPAIEAEGQSSANAKKVRKQGCYIATCVYGSYDCPQVWTLRRFRDERLSADCWGRLFIKAYYAISPIMVKLFGGSKLFREAWKKALDWLIVRLNERGFSDSPYNDRYDR